MSDIYSLGTGKRFDPEGDLKKEKRSHFKVFFPMRMTCSNTWSHLCDTAHHHMAQHRATLHASLA